MTESGYRVQVPEKQSFVRTIINKKFFEQQNIEQVSADSEEFRMVK